MPDPREDWTAADIDRIQRERDTAVTEVARMRNFMSTRTLDHEFTELEVYEGKKKAPQPED